MDERLSQRVEAFRVEMSSRSSKQFSDEQRHCGQLLAAELRGLGLSWGKMELLLGVSDTTIRRWVEAKPRADEGRWLPIVVSAPTPPARVTSGLTLHSGQGWWLEGLSLDEVAELLSRRV